LDFPHLSPLGVAHSVISGSLLVVEVSKLSAPTFTIQRPTELYSGLR
jgi:hypothetical protein